MRAVVTGYLALTVVAALGGGAVAGDSPWTAELAVRGATVLTMDGGLPVASAVAVRGDRIVYVGDDAGLLAYLGPQTRVVSGSAAQPITVLPGLCDAHAHLVSLGAALGGLDLRLAGATTTVSELVAKVRQVAQLPLGPGKSDWLTGGGWDQNRFSPPQLPTRSDLALLDAASNGRPVLLRRIDGHAGWLNSEALRRVGIDLSGPTADPPGGRILRDGSGQPTGVLVDNALSMAERVLPPPSPEQLEASILAGAAYVTARGLTAVHEMGIGEAEAEVYRRLAQQGRLPLRVYGYWADPMPAALAQLPSSSAYQQEMQKLRHRLGPPESGPLFSLRGIKLYMDGALGSRGAALSLPYSDEPQSSGLLLAPPEHIEAMAQWAIRNGYQVATHAIGDRANELVLRAYAQAGVKAPSNLRFRVEHAQVLPTSVVEQRRFAELGVIASVQPTHATSDMPWAESRLGPQRILNAYPWRSLLLSGARLVSGSDFPVEEADPRLTLHAAVTRRDVHGQPPAGWNPAQRLTVGEAIRTMTSDAAYAVFTEDRLGSLTIGRTADITLLGGSLSLDPSAPPPTDLVSRPVLLTVVGGRVVFDGLPRPSPPAPMKAKR